MMKSLKLFGVAAFLAATFAGSALAAPVFVGSWRVDEGPNWTTVPEAYTGQEAAALLFGGSPSDYAISTIDNDPGNIDNLAWVTVWDSGGLGYCGGGFPCGIQVAENFEVSTGGLYQTAGDTSAYAEDWAIGDAYRNYAFRLDSIPEPATLALLGLGLAGLGVARRRKAS